MSTTYTHSTANVAGAITRQLRSFAKRVGAGDPSELIHLKLIDDQLQDAYHIAVAGLREDGFSDGDIGRVLGVTGQAVNKRWPRTR